MSDENNKLDSMVKYNVQNYLEGDYSWNVVDLPDCAAELEEVTLPQQVAKAQLPKYDPDSVFAIYDKLKEKGVNAIVGFEILDVPMNKTYNLLADNRSELEEHVQAQELMEPFKTNSQGTPEGYILSLVYADSEQLEAEFKESGVKINSYEDVKEFEERRSNMFRAFADGDKGKAKELFSQSLDEGMKEQGIELSDDQKDKFSDIFVDNIEVREE
ncbi:hypothetical protein HOK51_01245 [Candidatus Woesearchaeota archaeon]|jgi:hypothetical protein|nr:hypothetical protein [Candidatus Woesearchaeota archaeon]MBT6518439.1 hypothetical protein [Candidatus Woesearchaeota archaeon]MBT7366606.1 hypothetical protein [Candidatus Woesearchaeota archaeon]